MLNPKIIFEDQDILVINKPCGLVVNRSQTAKDRTLQDWIEMRSSHYPQLQERIASGNNEFIRRSGLVHRLDKETSGVMVIAKNVQAFVNLQSQFKERQVVKKYLALAHGLTEPKNGNINLPLARKPGDRRHFGVRLNGRPAYTEYKRLKVIKRPSGEWLSLLEVSPKTGRTHQIRVHLASIHYPLVSDTLYLGHKQLKKDRLWCSRLFLHAFTLCFYHPKFGQKVCYKAELPRELAKIAQGTKMFS